jgi:hypothetical protein
MKKIVTFQVLVFSFVLSLVSTVSAEEKAVLQNMKPTDGWTLHIDAKKHIPKMPGVIAHHYCKQVSGGLL